MSNIPDWAIKAARETISDDVAEYDDQLSMGILNGILDNTYHIKAVTRALVAADKAATDRERERVLKLISSHKAKSTSRYVDHVCDCLTAAIAKGE